MEQRAGSTGSYFRKPALSTVPPPPTAPPPLPPAAVPAPGGMPAAVERHRLSFHGSGGTLFGIHVVNVFFMLLTLGFYYFWGKTRIRRYIFGESAFGADRFAYHGTAHELMLGFGKAFVLFIVPIVFLIAVRDVLDVARTIKEVAPCPSRSSST